MRRRRTGTAIAGAAVALLASAAAASGTATAAGAGETFLTGGLPLPPGAIAGGFAGVGSGNEAERVAVSDDGRWVAFVATSDALSADAHPDVVNVFRKDRQTGEVVLVSRANGFAGAPARKPGGGVRISDDGRRVGWLTRAALDPADLDGWDDVYVRDVASGQTLLATPGVSLPVSGFDLSGDGQSVAFATEASLTGDDPNAFEDVYRRQLAGPLRLVSARDGAMTAGNGDSSEPSISDDGRWVAFVSEARNLLDPAFAWGGGANVFVRAVDGMVTALASRSTAGATTGGNDRSYEPDVAGAPVALADVVVAFDSEASDLNPFDGDRAATVFVRSFANPIASVVSRADGGGANADSRAHTASISDDGRRVAFSSDAGNLGAGGGGLSEYGVYVRDVAAARTSLVSVDNDYAVQGALSGDGTTVAWHERKGVTADGDADLPGVYARTYASPPTGLGAVQLVSRPPGDAPYRAPAFSTWADGGNARTISGDGRYVVFVGYSWHLAGGAEIGHVYRRDTLTGAIELVSRETGPGGAPLAFDARSPTISADGTRVAFATDAALDPADGGTDEDVYVRDLSAGTTTLASRADGPDGAAPDADARDGRISADGRHVVFLSAAGNLGGPGGKRHAYLRDLAAARTLLVDRADGPGGAPADRDANHPSVSGDGRFVAWQTVSATLDPADPAPGSADVYVRDTVAGTTRLVSRRSGADGAKAVGSSFDPVLSDDGRVVAFQTTDEALAPEGGPWGGVAQVVARDLATHQNTLASRAPDGRAAAGSAHEPSVDGDGSVVAFSSEATNLLPGRGGSARSAVFARDMTTGALTGPPAFGSEDAEPSNHAYGPSLSADGQCLAFSARGHNPIGAAGDFETAYVHVVSGVCPKPARQQPQPSQPGPGPRQPGTRPPSAGAPPRLTKVSLLRRRFRVASAPTAVSAARSRRRRARRTPAGTAFRFTLDARATVTIAFERATRGRRVGKACRRATRRLRRRRACVRWVKVAPALTRRALPARRHSVAFSGRIGRRALKPGRYRATLRAGNAAGRSRPARVTFTVVRR